MARKVQIEEQISPNLVPMIDIMFLLLLFFMLSADMGQRELEAVVLPPAESVTPDTGTMQDPRLTINVHHRTAAPCAAFAKKHFCQESAHWHIGIRGDDFDTDEALLKKLTVEADRQRDPKDPRRSSRIVMIRSDGNAPYGLAQRVMNTCVRVGIYRIEVGAAQVKTEKTPKQ